MNPLLLFIDDDPLDVELACHTLAMAGVHVESRRVTDAEGLTVALAERSPVMVLADICLPRFDAWKALRICHGACPGVPFVVYSGTVGREDRRLCQVRGVFGVVEKDSPQDLVSVVRRALHR